MIYPEFLRTNDTIGIAAPSSGVGKKIESYERSLQVLRANGWQIKETPSVRNEGDRSADAKTRAEEFVSLFKDGGVNFVMCAAGGDFLFEILEDLDFEEMRNHPKWISGHSDPTGILYPYTVKYDVATFYAMNAGGYDVEPMPEYIRENLRMLRGERVIQKSSEIWNFSGFFLL
jgi:muramoyltetrapeptide carboxypeptidase LdcA involved in peptidoglycan recycling